MQLSPEAKAGVTVLISIILFAAMAMAVGRIDLRRTEGIELVLSFENVGGLVEGAPVRYAGVNVGTVTAVQLAGSQVLVKARLDRELLIPSDSRFILAASGILGDKYIEIQPGQAQEPMDLTVTISGVSPVSIDNMIQEVEKGLQSLNQVIARITEVAGSEQLQENLAATGELLRDTVSSLKTAVDQVNEVAGSVQVVVDDLAEFSRQMPELDLRSTFGDIQAFSQQLASINLVDPINEINQVAAELNALPLQEFAADVQRITQQLAGLDLAAIESDVRQFTSMLAAVEIQPLIDEILLVTDQIKALELEERSAEIAAFTTQLSTFPLNEIAADLQTVSRSLASVPVEAIAANVYDLSVTLAELPVDQVVADLQVVAAELKDIGWQEMAVQLAAFTNELAGLDFEAMFAGVVEDLHQFSTTIAELQLDALLAGVEEVVENLRAVSTAVDPNSVTAIMADLEGISANVHAVTAEINQMVTQINVDVQSFSRETLIALKDIQSIVTGVEDSVAKINRFIGDVTAEGETAADLRASLANIEAGTDELAQLLAKVSESFDSESGVFAQLEDTMVSIQKLNEDIEKVKTIGEKVDIRSTWSAHYNILDRRPMTGVSFEFWPQNTNSFILVGIEDILGTEGNHLQLQYGRQTGVLRQRYGMIDTSLGVGLDARIGDKWVLTGELKKLTTGEPTLSLQGNYAWNPSWLISLIFDDIGRDNSFRVGVERKF
ncbi:MAG: MCE family protein [Firmicutes bacterium]|jgi:virulence factor Mce-like protein|nr:MlaD family protein [Bacillota bacterium]NLL89086.1 MCE family protein [Bacillota bacterium]HKM16837.1 MlaD family protein [Limnochordia bacterium]